MTARHSLIPLALALLAAACSDSMGPLPTLAPPSFSEVAADSTDLHVLRQSPTAPPLATYRVAFWARHDQESTVAVDYRPAAGQSVGQPFLRFRIPKFGLKTGPDGTRLYGSDSVFITMTIDSVKLAVDFQPSGVTFSEVFAAGLIIWYANANPDLNGDGVVDATDEALQQQLALSEQPAKMTGWFKTATKNDATQKYVAAELYHFSQYAVAW
ncbi:MAG TPA: hypothetical protein VGQ06_02145 [Gemmatimonadales bacterium]|nr:hypothetical protein [Gemmatimonadales bacterium]